MSPRWVLPLGTAGSDGWDVVVDEHTDGWEHTGLYAGPLRAGERRTVAVTRSPRSASGMWPVNSSQPSG